MESLPKTGTSKIQKNVLRKKYGDNQEQIASGGKQSKKSEPVKS
jgi:acyl-coenzyme A synthetase/AMP-(fatty) acid ligase